MRKIIFAILMGGALFGILFSTLMGEIAFAGNSNKADNSVVELYTPKADNVIEPLLLRMPQSEKVKVWVFFTDKGIFSQGELQIGLESAKEALSERALKRREKVRGNNPVDFRDIPVYEPYVDAVLSTGVELKHRTKWFNGISVISKISNLENIAQLPFVRRVEMVKWLGTSLDEPKLNGIDGSPTEDKAYVYDYGPSESQLVQINVPPAHAMGFDGTGAMVCMLDVGFKKEHQAFEHIINEGRLIAEWDFINNDDDTDLEPGDDPSQADHGTLTWSTLGGQSDGHLYGPSFRADFILGKTEDITSEHHIEEDNWAAGAEWADSIGADVISSSLGYRYDFDAPDSDYSYSDMDGNTTIVTIAADLAAYNGIVVCNAMGNEGWYGDGSLIAPADADSIIACGAVDSEGYIAGFSSLGPTFDGRIKPEVVARGVGTDCASPNDMQGYTQASGTSLSTPLVGGAAGVVISAHPNWSVMQVREALMMTANNMGDPNNTFGWGLINTTKAIFYHPEGGVIFVFSPPYYILPGSEIRLNVEITCSDGLNSSSVKLYWNDDGSDNYNALQMTNNSNDFSAVIPAHSSGDSIFYYIYAEKSNGLSEVYPIGAPKNRFVAPISQPYFSDDFENGPYYWITGGERSDWGLTATDTHSGKLAFCDSPQGDYQGGSDSWMMLAQPLDFSSAQNPQLKFYHRYELRDGDYIYIEGSTDGGNSWDQIGQPITGNQYNYVEAYYSLEDFAGSPEFLLRFRLSTNYSVSDNGWFIDDISILWDGTDVDNESGDNLPKAFSLDANYPNPFNNKTSLNFRIPRTGYVDLGIFNLIGQKVRTLISEKMSAGEHSIVWDGRMNDGGLSASGIYFARLRFANSTKIVKMTLAK